MTTSPLPSSPASSSTEAAVEELAGLLGKGDVVIDGGNSFYKDDVRRAARLAGHGLFYLDVGTSGGVWGLERGYCMMIGGDKATVDHLDPIFAELAPGSGGIAPTAGRKGSDSRAERGYIHCGPNGAGHFVKMIHNGIEYGMMQAYAEGFELMHESAYTIDLAKVAALWDHGSVVRSWLLQLAARALAEDPGLSALTGYVEDSGEGRWTVLEGIERSVPMPVLTASLFTRFRSRQDNPFGDRMLAALRNQFGGHAVKKAK